MQKIIKDWLIIGFSDLTPILEEGMSAEEATAEEYQAWLEENTPKPEVFVSIFLPSQILLASAELRKMLDDALLLYSDIKRKTDPATWICEISNVALKFLPFMLDEDAYKFLQSKGIGFEPKAEIDAMFAELSKQKKPKADS